MQKIIFAAIILAGFLVAPIVSLVAETGQPPTVTEAISSGAQQVADYIPDSVKQMSQELYARARADANIWPTVLVIAFFLTLALILWGIPWAGVYLPNKPAWLSSHERFTLTLNLFVTTYAGQVLLTPYVASPEFVRGEMWAVMLGTPAFMFWIFCDDDTEDLVVVIVGVIVYLTIHMIGLGRHGQLGHFFYGLGLSAAWAVATNYALIRRLAADSHDRVSYLEVKNKTGRAKPKEEEEVEETKPAVREVIIEVAGGTNRWFLLGVAALLVVGFVFAAQYWPEGGILQKLDASGGPQPIPVSTQTQAATPSQVVQPVAASGVVLDVSDYQGHIIVVTPGAKSGDTVKVGNTSLTLRGADPARGVNDPHVFISPANWPQGWVSVSIGSGGRTLSCGQLLGPNAQRIPVTKLWICKMIFLAPYRANRVCIGNAHPILFCLNSCTYTIS